MSVCANMNGGQRAGRWLAVLAVLTVGLGAMPTQPDPEPVLTAVVAPNPLRVGYNGTAPLLRLTTGTTGVTVDEVVVYDLAGAEVRRIAAAELRLPVGARLAPNTTLTVPGWWNLQTRTGSVAASGVYWVHILAHLDGSATPVSSVQKLVVIR